jgi:hypothetical protein
MKDFLKINIMFFTLVIGSYSYGADKCPDAYDYKTWDGGCYGEFTYNEGNTYKGKFVNGEPHGEGSSLMPNGDGYKGQWQNGLPNGTGIYISDNGNRRYEGKFLDGKPHGKGVMISKEGSTYKGEFSNGIPVNSGVYTRITDKKDASPMRYGSGSSSNKTIKGHWENNKFIID